MKHYILAIIIALAGASQLFAAKGSSVRLTRELAKADNVNNLDEYQHWEDELQRLLQNSGISTSQRIKANEKIQEVYERLKRQTREFKVEFGTNRRGQRYFTVYLNNEEGTLLGTATVIFDTYEKSALLNQIGVVDKYQGSGVGTMLWDKMVVELKKLNIKKLTFTAVPPMDAMNPEWDARLNKLVNWYKKRGAKVIKIEDRTPFMEFDL